MREKISQNEWLIDQQRKSIESKDEQILALKKQVEDLSQKLEDKTIALVDLSEGKIVAGIIRIFFGFNIVWLIDLILMIVNGRILRLINA